MPRDEEALARRVAREARRAASRVRENGDGAESDGGNLADPVRAAREAAAAAAVGAAVGALRAISAKRGEAAAPDESIESDEPDEEDELEPEDEPEEEDDEREPEPVAETEQRPRADVRRREGARLEQVAQAVQAAREQLQGLTGSEAEMVSSFGRTRDGWRVTLEVVEVRRIPETTDVLASYEVELDENGDLVALERIRRYQRSEALDGS
jgi:hypothetical protein